MPEIAGQRPAPASLTRGNINDFHRPGKISQPPHGEIKIRQFVFPQASSEFLNTQLCRYFNNFYFRLFPRLAYLTLFS